MTRNSTQASSRESLHEAYDKDQESLADAALIETSLLSSDPDLYFAKLQFEERLKFALRYEFSFETPLTYVQRFFECAFAPEQRCKAGAVRDWQVQTEHFIKNTTVFPLS